MRRGGQSIKDGFVLRESVVLNLQKTTEARYRQFSKTLFKPEDTLSPDGIIWQLAIEGSRPSLSSSCVSSFVFHLPASSRIERPFLWRSLNIQKTDFTTGHALIHHPCYNRLRPKIHGYLSIRQCRNRLLHDVRSERWQFDIRGRWTNGMPTILLRWHG